MQELGSASCLQSGAEADRLGINSYLELIGGDGNERGKGEAKLPELTAQPWRISDIKSKMSSAANSKTGKGSKVVGKLGSFAFKSGGSANGEKHTKQSVEVNTNKIKEMFEDNAKMGSKRTVSELDLGPRRKKVVVIEPLLEQKVLPTVQRRDSVKTKAWSHRLASYWPQKSSKREECESKAKPQLVEAGRQQRQVEEDAWKAIEDPDERKRAILLKHGFKPRDPAKDAERELGSVPKSDA